MFPRSLGKKLWQGDALEEAWLLFSPLSKKFRLLIAADGRIVEPGPYLNLNDSLARVT